MDAFTVKHVATNPHDWPMVNGNLPRNAQAKGSPPMLDHVLWMRHTLRDKSEETGEEQQILIHRLESTLRALGGARPTVSEDEIEALLRQQT